MLHLLLEDREELLQYVETIERATEQASQLTAQILSFARGSKKSQKEVLNLNRLVEDFCSMLDRLVNRRIVIEKQLMPELWNIEADRTQIEQVLMNMTMNSIDAMENGGTIVYRTENVEVKEATMLFSSRLEENEAGASRPVKKIVGGHVLLVDDEEMLQQTVSRMLENLNFEVTIARDGQEAVEIFRQNPKMFDLILMDIQMPNMDGIEAAKRIWQDYPDARIIFSTGYADPERLELLRRLGVKQILRKPYKIKDLVDIISIKSAE